MVRTKVELVSVHAPFPPFCSEENSLLLRAATAKGFQTRFVPIESDKNFDAMIHTVFNRTKSWHKESFVVNYDCARSSEVLAAV